MYFKVHITWICHQPFKCVVWLLLVRVTSYQFAHMCLGRSPTREGSIGRECALQNVWVVNVQNSLTLGRLCIVCMQPLMYVLLLYSFRGEQPGVFWLRRKASGHVLAATHGSSDSVSAAAHAPGLAASGVGRMADVCRGIGHRSPCPVDSRCGPGAETFSSILHVDISTPSQPGHVCN
jgi:hypothetical protein